jgi:hypothetical protein
MAKFTPENCEELASHIVDGMDTKTLCRIVFEQLEENYLQDEESFHRDWDDYCMDY